MSSNRATYGPGGSYHMMYVHAPDALSSICSHGRSPSSRLALLPITAGLAEMPRVHLEPGASRRTSRMTSAA